MTPILVKVRFGLWENISEDERPNSSMKYAALLYHFGMGMAKSNQMKLNNAKDELKIIEELMKDSSLLVPMTPFSPAIEGAIIAKNILAGSIAMNEKKYENAIAYFRKAASTEESMVYNEPRDWLLNPKHYLGNAYLKNGQPAEAEKTFKKDLLNNNENGWALFGLYQSLMAQKKNAEADKVMTRFKKAFKNVDVKLVAAVY